MRALREKPRSSKDIIRIEYTFGLRAFKERMLKIYKMEETGVISITLGLAQK